MSPTIDAFRIRVFAAILVAVAGSINSPSSFAKDDDGLAAKEFQRLDGRWKVVRLEVDGQIIATEEEWCFFAGNYSWKNSKWELRGSNRINCTFDPPQITFMPKYSSESGRMDDGDTRNWSAGIYKFADDGDTLTVCIGRLPSREFATSKGDNRRLYVLKRIKDGKPLDHAAVMPPRKTMSDGESQHNLALRKKGAFSSDP